MFWSSFKFLTRAISSSVSGLRKMKSPKPKLSDTIRRRSTSIFLEFLSMKDASYLAAYETLSDSEDCIINGTNGSSFRMAAHNLIPASASFSPRSTRGKRTSVITPSILFLYFSYMPIASL